MSSQTFTFTGASSDVTNYQRIAANFNEAPLGRSDSGDQMIRVSADGNAASGSATLQIVEIDPITEKVLWREDITLSHPATARRTGYDNSSGNYVLSAVASTSGNHFVDIGAIPRGRVLMIGCTALTTMTQIVVRVDTSRTI